MLVSYHAIIVKLYVIVRLSYDYRSTIVRYTYDLASHQAIIVKSYVIVRLSFDCRTMSYDLPTISQTFNTDASQTHRVQCDNKTIRLQYRTNIVYHIF